MSLAAHIPWTSAWHRRRNEKLCRQTGERIQEIVDGELSKSVATRTLMRHLDACRACNDEAAAIEQLKQAIARIGRDADPEIVDRLRSYARDLCEGRRDTAD